MTGKCEYRICIYRKATNYHALRFFCAEFVTGKTHKAILAGIRWIKKN